MRVLIAPDKFKDALTAPRACGTIADGLRAAHPDWTLDLCPLADGGEGFARILCDSARGEWRTLAVSGPHGDTAVAGLGMVQIGNLPPAVRARCAGLPPHGKLAVIEMAAASGLALLPADKRDVWHADTQGVGELIADAIRLGSAGILLGVGGSATNDLGLGALAALGARPLTTGGQPAPGCAPHFWPKIARIALDNLQQVPPVWIACDVVNPLLGPDGAASVYGRQKGLRAEDLPRLDGEASRIAALIAGEENAGRLANIPGAGAAGGIAFGFMAVFGAQLVPGFELVSDWLALDKRIREADLVITGEGRFDSSSLQGKGAGALALAARACGKPVKVFAGRVEAVAPEGIEIHEISPRETPLDESLAKAAALLRARVAETMI